MIRSLSGRILDISGNVIVIEAGGIGFEVTCTRSAIEGLSIGQEARIITWLQWSQNGASIYGFGSELERVYFSKILDARGIGAKLAVSILSDLSLGEIYRAVSEREPQVFCRVPGLGKSKAERLCLDLKNLPVVETETKHDSSLTVTDALISLGFSRDDAMSAINLIRAARAEDFGTLTDEEMLRLALRELNRS